MKSLKINRQLPIVMLALMLAFGCRKKTNNPTETKLDDDGKTEERAMTSDLESNLGKIGTGQLKALLDTNNLGKHDRYFVVFKPSFQKPLADGFNGTEDEKLTKAQMAERNIMSKATTEFDDKVIDDTADIEWHATFTCGFTTFLTQYQVKELYKDDRVDYIARDFEYEVFGDVVYNQGTKPLFVHKYKKPSSATKKIWIIDTGGDIFSPGLNVDATYSKSFNGYPLSYDADHGNCVAHVAGAVEYGGSNCRGTAEGAKIVMLKAGNGTQMNWSAVNDALEYCWYHSKKGDIVNLSFGTKVSSASQSNLALLLQMEQNILYFKGWDMPVVMAAGNSNDFASAYSPCRLGLKCKDDPTNYRFIHVVANIKATGTDEQVKNGTSEFVLNDENAKPSNYGRAVRWAAMGTWQVVRVDKTAFIASGTSFSAPAVAGILYHNSSPLYDPETLLKYLKYQKGNTIYLHMIPKAP